MRNRTVRSLFSWGSGNLGDIGEARAHYIATLWTADENDIHPLLEVSRSLEKSINDFFWKGLFPGVRCYEHAAGYGFGPESDGEELYEADMAVAALVEAEDELFEKYLEIGSSQPVTDVERPGFEVGEGPMDPKYDDLNSQAPTTRSS